MIFLWIFNKNFIWSSVLLSLTTINLTTASNCRFEKNTTDEWSKLQSPGFPQRFPVQFQCYWKLTTIFTHRIKLQFTKIFLVKPDQDRVCNTQWISIVDKYRAPGPTEVKICGKANPGVAISTGNIFEITLFSNSKFERYDYQGFEVTFIMTLDSPVLPGLISPAVNRNQPRQTTAAIQTTKRSRQQNKFNSLNAGQSQSEKIEELNRKRNLGIQVMQNPVFENGLERRYFKPVPITKKTTTSLSDTKEKAMENNGVISNGLKIALIIIGGGLALLLIFCICRKANILKKIQKRKKPLKKKKNISNQNVPDEISKIKIETVSGKPRNAQKDKTNSKGKKTQLVFSSTSDLSQNIKSCKESNRIFIDDGSLSSKSRKDKSQNTEEQCSNKKRNNININGERANKSKSTEHKFSNKKENKPTPHRRYRSDKKSIIILKSQS